jgi:tropomyosin-2
LEFAAAEERRLQYIRTEVMGRVVKRLGNMVLARAFGSWAQRVRDSREEILVSALTEMQNGMTTKDTLLLQQQQQQQTLQQRLKGTQEEVESIKLEFADVFDATEQLQQIVSKARAERADMLELISLLETCLQDKTAELHHQQQLLQDSQYRAQRLDEVLQQSSQEYEQQLQLSAEQIESLKVELAERMQQAATHELEAAQRSLQLRDEYEPAIAAEMKRLEKLGQQLQKQQQLLQQERAEIRAQRSAIQIQTSTAEAALSSVAQQQATMLVQHSQLSANSDDAKTRWELQQVSSLFSSLRHGYILISRLNCSNDKPKRYSAFKLT